MRFQGMTPATERGERSARWKTPEARLDLRSEVPFGTPSAWLFLVRLHACRAGLRFTRFTSLHAITVAGKVEIAKERPFRRVEDWSGRPDEVSGVRHATVEEKGRPGTRLRRIASGRKQTQVHGPMRPTRIEGSRRHRQASFHHADGPTKKPPVSIATSKRVPSRRRPGTRQVTSPRNELNAGRCPETSRVRERTKKEKEIDLDLTPALS